MTLTKEEKKMNETFIAIGVVTCLACGLLSITLMFISIAETIECFEWHLVCAFIASIALGFLSFAGGYTAYTYYNETEFCPNCHYEFKVLSNYDYCLQCGVKIKNKCDSCNRILLDNALAVCSYCGESIQTKVGELPTKVN